MIAHKELRCNSSQALSSATFTKSLLSASFLDERLGSYNVDMALLPAVISKTAPSDALVETLMGYLSEGKHPRDIARNRYPRREDRGRRRKLYVAMRDICITDPRIMESVVADAKLEIMLALPKASRALGDKAGRGYEQAIKLLFEASGFHNPRIRHEHSGDIKITLDIPRPTFEGSVTDAQVVE